MNTRKTQPKPNADPAPVQHTDGQPRFVGVDLHKRVATFHVLFQNGTSLKSGSFDVDPDSIRGFAAKHLRPTDHLVSFWEDGFDELLIGRAGASTRPWQEVVFCG